MKEELEGMKREWTKEKGWITVLKGCGVKIKRILWREKSDVD